MIIDQLQSLPIEEVENLLNGLLVDSWTASQWFRLSPATLRNPGSKYYKFSIKIGQYRYWRREDLEQMSPRTIEFTYIFGYDENGPRYRTDKITIRPYGKRGWEWDNHDGAGFSGRTNDEGDGLWWWDESMGGWQEQLGTIRFSLPRDARKALYKLAKREAVFRSVGGVFDELEVDYKTGV